MQIEATWWISAVEAPIVAALFYMLHGLRRDMQERIDRSDQRENEVVGRARDELAEFKLEVARSYVPLSLIATWIAACRSSCCASRRRSRR
ncbi:hypothetical protein ACFQU2_23540 [Siccirubricoccus deserti]